MSERRVLAYGAWPSPITIEMAVSSAVRLSEPRFAGGDVYWTEGRPLERGRQVIVRWNEREGAVDVTPPPFNARTMAHEYGGGWYAPSAEGTVYFSNLADGRIYRQPRDGQPQPLTADGPFRYGDLVLDAANGRLLCVREDWTGVEVGAEAGEGERIPEPRDALVAVDLASGAQTVLAEGADFYSTPRPSDDGRRLAWLAWQHPNMPWDGSELWVADVDAGGALANPRQVAGGSSESVVQPEWAPDGSLVFVCDRDGWWNLFRWSGTDEPRPVLTMDAEFAGPQWVFGMAWYGIAADGTIYATVRQSGTDALWRISPDGSAANLAVPDTGISDLHVGNGRLGYLGQSPTTPASVVLLDSASGERRVLRQAFEVEVDTGYLSVPEAIEFPTTDGHTAHALFYPPTNPDVAGPQDEKPPLVVMIHGGPTSSTSAGLSLGRQVFTSRGFAVVDVNYRGSSGYGRDYMRLLDGKWGVYDVEDCIAAARFLAQRGDVDPRRMAIRGGSAGGFTTLAALTAGDVFAAGASHFGVSDLEALARDTHKFESRYLDRLVAPYPEGIAVYRERSPIHSIDRLRTPLLVLQGADDKVVPVAQAERIVAALRQREVPHAYLLFEGEGHGFRQATNIRHALEAELSFYAQVFRFELGDAIEPIKVEFGDKLAQRT